MIFYKTVCHVTQTDVLQDMVSDINKVICYNKINHVTKTDTRRQRINHINIITFTFR